MKKLNLNKLRIAKLTITESSIIQGGSNDANCNGEKSNVVGGHNRCKSINTQCPNNG